MASKICAKSVSGDQGCGAIVGREACGFGVTGGGVTGVDGTRADSGTESSDCCSRTSAAVSSDPEIAESVLHGLMRFEKQRDCLHCCPSRSKGRSSNGAEGFGESQYDGSGALLQGWMS